MNFDGAARQAGGAAAAIAPNPPDEEELMDALWRGEALEVVRSVVERRPRLVQQEVAGLGYLPLHVAVAAGSPPEVLRYLYGLDPGAILPRRTPAGQFYHPLHVVGRRTPPESVSFLIDRFPVLVKVKVKGDRDDLPLHCAIFNGAHQDAVQVLVERHPQALEEANADGLHAIHAAALSAGPNQLGVVQYLLEVSPMSAGQWTTPSARGGGAVRRRMLPLHLALQDGAYRRHVGGTPEDDGGDGAVDPEVVRVLLERGPEAARERVGARLPLRLAVFSAFRSAEVVRMLLDAHPEALRERQALCGSTLLHDAAKDPATPRDLLRLLVDSWPEALLEADAAEGDLPIHAALKSLQPSLENLGMLVERCPESLCVANARGKRPVHVAIDQDCLEAVRLFADRWPEVLRRAVDRHGNAPAHVAAARHAVSADLLRCVAGAWPESLLEPNDRGDLPIHVAIDQAYPAPEAVRVFAEHCPESLRVANAGGCRPLFAAIARNHLDIVRLLVEKDPESVRHVDPETGRTALHVAAASSEQLSPGPLLQFLSGAWPEALRFRDAAGDLPLFLAAENDRMDLDEVLLLLRACPDVVLGCEPSSLGEGAERGRTQRPPATGCPAPHGCTAQDFQTEFLASLCLQL